MQPRVGTLGVHQLGVRAALHHPAGVDDDLAVQAADTGDWLAANPHVLVIAPDLFVGLTHEQLDAIEAWL